MFIDDAPAAEGADTLPSPLQGNGAASAAHRYSRPLVIGGVVRAIKTQMHTEA
jgi:hypothetical protein